MASSAMKFHLGVLWFLSTTHTETNARAIHPGSSCAVQHLTYVYFYEQNAVHGHSMNYGCFDHMKPLNIPNCSSMLGWRWHRFWDFWSIYVVLSETFHTWINTKTTRVPPIRKTRCLWKWEKMGKLVCTYPACIVINAEVIASWHLGFDVMMVGLEIAIHFLHKWVIWTLCKYNITKLVW